MPKSIQNPMQVECTDCHFARVISPEDEELPADVVIEHGQETGHTLSTHPVDE